MSETLVTPGSVRRVIFGERLLLPLDTAVQVTVGVLNRYYGQRPRARSDEKVFLGYTVGLSLTVSHANLPDRRRAFSYHSHRLSFDVLTSHIYDFSRDDRNSHFFRSEVTRVTPIFLEMEDLTLKDYLGGEVSFETLRTHFTDEYRRRSGTRSKRTARKR